MTPSIRRVVRTRALRLLRAFQFDTRIRHHWVPSHRILINTFQHKGYWYSGKRRETKTLQSMQFLIKPGQTVVEVGGHIGYLSVLFGDLVGPNGKVIVFEPSDENRKYLAPNVAAMPQIKVETPAVSDSVGEAEFFVETLTGQNNSLVEDYDVFERNAEYSGLRVDTKRITVQVTTLDHYCRENGVRPDLIKIDIEGAEKQAIMGGLEMINSCRPVIMAELTIGNAEVYELFGSIDYVMLNEDLTPLGPEGKLFNHFFMPREKLAELGLRDRT